MVPLEHRPGTLVGHDLGGGVVHIAAVRRPDLCAGLITTDGTGCDSWPIPSVGAMQAAAPVLSPGGPPSSRPWGC